MQGSRKPGQEGDWTPDQNPQFRQTQKMAGAELLMEDKDKRWKEKANADFQWEGTDDRTAQSTENYLPTGSSFARNLSSSTNDATSFWATNEFTWLKPFRLYTRLNTSYTKSEGQNFSRAAEFNHNPIAFGGPGQILDSLFATPASGTLSAMTVNRTQNSGLQHGDELNLGGEIQFTNKLKNGDELMLWYKGFYTQQKSEDYSQYRLDYLQGTAEADDRNPLAVTLGNPNLKGKVEYTLQPIISYAQLKRHIQLNITPYFHTTRHSVANGYNYNPETGVYTYRPENVEGVWYASLGLWGTCPLDTPKRWRLRGQLSNYWNHDVNLMAVNGSTEALPNHMQSYNIYGKLDLEYSNSRVTTNIYGDGQKVHSHSELDGLKDVHVTNFSYGLACTVQLPWKLSLSTDLQMFSKRGYSERSMNTDDLVWNAQLSRSFLKGQLTAVLEGFDLLGQLSPKDFNVSATRQIEVNHLNALPRYVMLHLKYAFHKSPKKL